MHCIKCGKNIPSDSKFCQFCGIDLPNLKLEVDESIIESCQFCGAKAPVKYTEYYANIGMILARRELSAKGKMCRNCIDKYFLHYTLTNIFLGWWGIISFFATCIFIINNIIRYIMTINLKKY